MDRELAPLPPGSACQSSATGTCHLRNVFIFSQSLARFPPHSLRAGRGGQEREGKGHRQEQKRTGRPVPESPLCKTTHQGPCQSCLPRGLTAPLVAPQTVSHHPAESRISPWPVARWGRTAGQGPNIRAVTSVSPAPRTPVQEPS